MRIDEADASPTIIRSQVSPTSSAAATPIPP
jgi:hypothetical protein